MSCKGFVNLIPVIRSSITTLSRLTNPSNFNSLKTCVGMRFSFIPISNVHTTSSRLDLMEFFEDKKNWGKNEIRVGRSWRKEELRIKSNSDLHKLWFVLLKERNMLMTTEEECNRKCEIFANPERLDKVRESMHNLEEVVMERNRAYHLLETGETGERPCELVYNQFGLKTFHKMTEHLIPKRYNKKWRETHVHSYDENETKVFLKLYREKLFLTKRKEKKRQQRYVYGLLRTFPKIDVGYLKELYPDMDIEKMKHDKRSRGSGAQLL